MTTERIGQRVYITGDSYAIKDRLKAAGCHWDGERRQWWIGEAKAEELQTILAAPSPATPSGVPDSTRIVAKAKYKGRNYYVPWVGETKSGDYKCRLVTLDGSIDFWATAARPHETTPDGSGDIAAIVKTYAPREHRGRTEHTTLGSLRRFITQQASTNTRRGECTECGAWGPSGHSCTECGGEGNYV